jgi:membrane protein YdbS with pleckstrin-like domain
MSQLDKVKEKIAQLKYWLGVLLGAFVALSTWLFNNIKTADLWQTVIVCMLLSIFAIFIFKLNAKMTSQIERLEDI